jgi:hypothetical protein
VKIVRDATSGFEGISDILKNQPISSRGARRDWVTVLGRPERQVVLVIWRPADGAGDDQGPPRVALAESSDVLRWSQRAIDLADGDPSKGNFIIGSPLSPRFYDAGSCSLFPGSSRMARRPTARRGHRPHRRPPVLRRW